MRKKLRELTKNELFHRKLAFVQRHKIKKGDVITDELVQKARDEIGYSDKTVSIDISCSLNGFVNKNVK